MSNVRKVEVKVSGKGLSSEYKVAVSMNFEGVEREELIDMAMRGQVIKLQGQMRSRGDGACSEWAGSGLEVHASKLLSGKQVTTGELVASVATMTDEQKEALKKALGL